MRRYLITGITGFVGPNLANHLIKRGDIVFGLVRTKGSELEIKDIVPDNHFKQITFLYGDFTKKEDMDKIFKENKFDGVFHVGAFTHPPTSFTEPEKAYEANYLGTKNIVDAIKVYQRDCALMYCSSAEVYGIVEEKDQPITEHTQLRPANPYGMTKALGDVYVLSHASIKAEPFNIKAFVTRAFSHTGLRRASNFSVSSDAYQLVKIKKGLQEPVINIGTLSSLRPVMDVKDCVRAYTILMEMAIKGDERVIGEIFTICGDRLFSMRELLDKMLEHTQLKGKVKEFLDLKLVRKIDIPVQFCDDSKFRNLTGFKQEKDVLEDTLPDLLNYWEEKL